jgi:NADPH-dependent ferric siderophore reductase
MPFAVTVTTSSEVSAEVMASIGLARQNAGTAMPLTSMEAEMSTTGSLPTNVATVVSNRELTPNLREIVVEGDFDPFVSHGLDEFVYVFVGRDGPLPDGYTMARFMSEDPADRQLGAYYTIRTWEPDAGRITMWFVTHGHEGGVGGWSARAQPGERIALWGPRASFEVPDGATGHVFVTDESGFAAVATRIEALPDDAEIIVIAETVDESHTLPLAAEGRADVRWVFRGDRAPGTGTALIDAVRELDLDRPGLVAFGAGESKQMSAIRRLLRRDHGFAADHVSMTGYWRRDKH